METALSESLIMGTGRDSDSSLKEVVLHGRQNTEGLKGKQMERERMSN